MPASNRFFRMCLWEREGEEREGGKDPYYKWIDMSGAVKREDRMNYNLLIAEL